MILLINICTIAILMIVAIEDFRIREIHWILFPILAIFFFIDGILNMAPGDYLIESFYNLVFLSFQGFFLVLYYRLKGIPLKKYVNSSIGSGDLLYLLILILAFPHINFVVFYISGLLFSLSMWLWIRIFLKKKQNMLPLTGFLALFTALIQIFDLLPFDFNRYNDHFLLEFFNG